MVNSSYGTHANRPKEDIMNKPTITQSLVNSSATLLSGKSQQKFFASIDVLNRALDNDQWESRGQSKVEMGLRGFIKYSDFPSYGLSGWDHKTNKVESAMESVLFYGFGVFDKDEELDRMKNNMDEVKSIIAKLKTKKGRTEDAIISAINMMIEVKRAFDYLNSVVVQSKLDISSLSDRQRDTLSSSLVDIDFMSLRLAKIVYPVTIVPVYPQFASAENKNHRATACYSVNVFAQVPAIEWEQGTIFGATGKQGHQCDACGKNIPSQMFVFLQATCKRTGRTLGLQFGTDCAHRMLNVKSDGVRRGLNGVAETVDGEYYTARPSYDFLFTPSNAKEVKRALETAINTEEGSVWDRVDNVGKTFDCLTTTKYIGSRYR
jgi:hypothetical protein